MDAGPLKEYSKQDTSLHVADSGLIPDTPYGSQALPRVQNIEPAWFVLSKLGMTNTTKK